MKIKWLGHACFVIESKNGTRLVTDPYDVNAYPNALFYKPIDIAADYVTISHNHGDHNYATGVRGAKVIDTAGTHKFSDITVVGIQTFHDDAGGSLRGENIVFKIEFPDFTVVHCGDLGDYLTDEQITQLGKVDILLIPVGGTYTVDSRAANKIANQMDPRLIIPMHFKTPKIKFPIDPVDKFLIWRDDYVILNTSELDVDDAINSEKKVFVLEPAL